MRITHRAIIVAAALLIVPALTFAATADKPTVTCKDGTTGPGGRGACHGHGGIDKSAGSAAAPAAAPAPAPAPAAAAEKPTVTCKDGTTGPGGRGACHGHGGIDKGAKGTASAPAAAPEEPAAAPATHAATKTTHTEKAAGGKAATADPAGALAKCKDGMYWHGTHHSGSCSHHGGVEQWMDK